MSALNSNLFLDPTEFKSDNSTSEEDWWLAGIFILFRAIFRIIIDLNFTFALFILIPSKFVRQVLAGDRAILRGYSTPKILVISLMALIFYLNNADHLIISLIVFILNAPNIKKNGNYYNTNDIFDTLWRQLIWILTANDEDLSAEDEPDEDYEIDFGKHRELGALFDLSSLFWLVLSTKPLTWFNSDRSWNIFKGIFAHGMEWQLYGQLLLLTYHALDAIQKGVYGRLVCRSSKQLAPMAAIFLVLLFDDQIWNVDDADKREKMARVYLFVYLSLFTTSVYSILKIAFTKPDEEVNLRRIKQYKAGEGYMRLAYGSMLLLYCGSETFCTPYFLIFIYNGLFIGLSLFIDFKTYLNRFAYLPISRQTLELLSFGNTMVLKLEFFLVLLRMSVCQHVTFLRVGTMVVVVGFILKDTWAFFEDELSPRICVWFLPRATVQQLALNDNVCLICHEELESACVTPCKHFYHADCLLAWLYRDQRCPMCQYVLYCYKCHVRLCKKAATKALLVVIVLLPPIVMYKFSFTQ